MNAKRISEFWTLRDVLELFKQMGCEVRTAEPTIVAPDGDCFNVRYLLHVATGAAVPIVDVADDDRISEGELQYWERRLGVTIPRPCQLN